MLVTTVADALRRRPDPISEDPLGIVRFSIAWGSSVPDVRRDTATYISGVPARPVRRRGEGRGGAGGAGAPIPMEAGLGLDIDLDAEMDNLLEMHGVDEELIGAG
eukprot:1310432-Pyramimonas_sp.AAC.1